MFVVDPTTLFEAQKFFLRQMIDAGDTGAVRMEELEFRLCDDGWTMAVFLERDNGRVYYAYYDLRYPADPDALREIAEVFAADFQPKRDVH